MQRKTVVAALAMIVLVPALCLAQVTIADYDEPGNWVVRNVEKIDEAKRHIWFQASGMYPGKDPYYIH